MKLTRSGCLLAALAACLPTMNQAAPAGLQDIEHIVVIYLENRSFDSLFGEFPGADGLAQAVNAPPQSDVYGNIYTSLPPVMIKGALDNRFPEHLPNAPFDIARHVKPDQKHPDLTHRFFIHQMQINGGRNDRFAAMSSAGGLTMGHYTLPDSALWQYAKQYTLADHFFQAAFGGSFLNHQWLICACTPVFPEAPAELRKWKHDADTGRPTGDPDVTEDGHAVGMLQPYYPPFDAEHAVNRLPPQYKTTIGDRLSEKGISWAWYAGGWDDAVATIISNTTTNLSCFTPTMRQTPRPAPNICATRAACSTI